MKATELLCRLTEILEADPDAVVCVFDGELCVKPKACAPDCLSWQDEVGCGVRPDACDSFVPLSHDPDECFECAHPKACHGVPT